jgi:homocysteine S-methyltransferase
MAGFPAPRPGVVYLTEGGTETELMYKHGHDLPEFAMYPLLDDPAAVADLSAMYSRYFEVAAVHALVQLVGGLDYRASPNWSAKLGISTTKLRDFQLRSIDFLRAMARQFEDRIETCLFAGLIGPRNDAYAADRSITADEAEEYHAVQLAALREAEVDLVSALTFNSVPEAIGLARATANVGLPLSMSFITDAAGCLFTGPTLQEAIETVDAATGDVRPDFFGINCAHPLEFESALVAGAWQQRLRSLRPNASAAEKIALCQIGHLEAGDPALLGKQMAALSRRLPSVDIFGGCCGTWDDHLGAIASELSAG